jgi:hypothetical protein
MEGVNFWLNQMKRKLFFQESGHRTNIWFAILACDEKWFHTWAFKIAFMKVLVDID